MGGRGSGPRTGTRHVEEEFKKLDALSRIRRLDDHESLRLEKLVRQLDRDRADERQRRKAGRG